MRKIVILKENDEKNELTEKIKNELENNFEIKEILPKDLLRMDYDLLIIFGEENFVKNYENLSKISISIDPKNLSSNIKIGDLVIETEAQDIPKYIKLIQYITASRFFPDIVFYNSTLENDWPWYTQDRTIEEITKTSLKDFKDNPYIWRTRINPQHIEKVKKRKTFLLSDSKYEFLFQLQNPDGKYIWLLSKEIYLPQIKKTAGVLIDIDSIKRILDKHTINLKMDFLHEFLSVTNHQINNTLASVIGYIDVLDKKISKYSDFYSEFIELNNSIKKLIEIINRYTMFSNRVILKKEKINLCEMIDQIKDVIRLVIRKDIKGIIRIDEKNLIIESDPITIQQIIYGLCAYISEFIVNDGELIITLRKEQKNIIFSVSDFKTSTQDFAVINIAGRCREEDLKNMREIYFNLSYSEMKIYSYFSLPSIEKNIEKLDGWLKIDKLDDFLFFEVKIPLYNPIDQSKEVKKTISNTNKTKKILLCEDDEGLRKFVERILKENGYIVISCSKLSEMASIIQNYDVDLIFTDIELVDGDSFEIVSQIKNNYPNIKIIFNSGYVDDKSRWYDIEKKGFKFMQKPYTIRELINTIEEELNN